MCDYEENKMAYANIYKETLCHACLSSDRRLFPLNENADIYQKVCDFKHTVLNSHMHLCWECMAMLKRIILFRNKVQQAQWTLENNFKHSPVSLSKLTTVKIGDTSIFTSVENDETNSPEIKQDFDTNDDDFTDNYTYLDEIKQEIKDTQCEMTSQETKNGMESLKSKNSQLIYNSPREKLWKRVKINIKDVKHWMKIQKNNLIYRSFKYKCRKCVYGWNCKEKWRQHNQKYHDKAITPYECDICDSRFSAKPSLRTHMKTHNRTHVCVTCGYQCYTRHVMSRHVLKHKNCIQCEYCIERLQSLRAYYKHFKFNHGVLLCDHCGKGYKSKRTLEKHMRHHFEIHECKICNKRFQTAGGMRNHMDIKHVTVRTEATYCVQCDRQFDNITIFKRHLQTSIAHVQERSVCKRKSIPCPDCGKTYSRRFYMMNHYRYVHMKKSNYYCDQCDRYFLNRTRFVGHMKYNHQGVKTEKTKLCNICGRGFSTNRILIHHIRTHTGERPHACTQCGARFAQQHALHVHVRRLHGREETDKLTGIIKQ